jgi:hypothetical protein
MMRFLVDDAFASRTSIGKPVRRRAGPVDTGRPIDEALQGGQAGSKPAYRYGMKRCDCGALMVDA